MFDLLNFIVQRSFIQMKRLIIILELIEGNIIVYTPQVKVGETYAQVYVHNGEDADYYNLITTGWMVKFLLTILILMHFNSSS